MYLDLNMLKLCYNDLENIKHKFVDMVKLKYDVDTLEFIDVSNQYTCSEIKENTPAYLRIKLKNDDFYYEGEIWLNNYILNKGRIFCHLVPSKWIHPNYFNNLNHSRDNKRFELEEELTKMIDQLV